MSNATIAAVSAGLICAFAVYHFSGNFTNAPDSRQSPDGFVGASSHSVETLAARLTDYHNANQAQMQKFNSERSALTTQIAGLQQRLDHLQSESIAHPHPDKEAQAPEPDADLHHSDPAPVREPRSELSNWMQESLNTGILDADLTSLSRLQAEANAAELPGVQVTDMQCGSRFCKANFRHENGGPPELSALFGQPPFLGEGMTINETDGSVSVYFTQPGESLASLRTEASQGYVE